MAKTLQYSLISIMLILLSALVTSTESHSFSRKLSPESIGLKKEKLAHIHFYFHDILTSKNPTSIPIINSTSNSSLGFGAVFMADSPLTAGPDINSKLVGKAQGLSGSASQKELQFLMLFNFVFSEGEYNGSTLSLFGHNDIFSSDREMPIVGGSKVFRFARGYAKAKIYSYDPKTNNNIVEYNLYVFHY